MVSNEQESNTVFLDHLSSPVRLANASNCDTTFSYDDFGQRTTTNSDTRHFVVSYTGYIEDGNGIFAQNRYYQPENGRFTTKDPIKGILERPISLNPYIYVWDNPINMVDYDGLKPAFDSAGGTEAHTLLGLYFLALYGTTGIIYGDVEVYIPNAGYYGTDGRADYVLYDQNGVGSIEVYELKPASHYNHLEDGYAQLNGYVQGLREQHLGRGQYSSVHAGGRFIPNIMIPSAQHPGWYIIYYTDGSGMIYYDYVQNQERENVTVWIPEEEMETSRSMEQSAIGRAIEEYGIIVTILLALGYGIWWILWFLSNLNGTPIPAPAAAVATPNVKFVRSRC